MTRRLELELWAEANMVSTTRRFVEEVFERVFDDPDAVARVAMAAHELLENAVKYSTAPTMRLRVTVAPGAGADRVSVAVLNTGRPEHIERLRASLEEMRKDANPFSYYQKVMRRSAGRTDGSGLGLARVRCEGEMELDLILDGDRVCLEASAEIAAEGAR